MLVVTTVPVNDERRLSQPFAISVIRMQILITRTIGPFVFAKRADVCANKKGLNFNFSCWLITPSISDCGEILHEVATRIENDVTAAINWHKLNEMLANPEESN